MTSKKEIIEIYKPSYALNWFSSTFFTLDFRLT